MKKYKIQKGRLFSIDGTVFDVHAPSRVGKWVRGVTAKSGKKIPPFHATKLLRSDLQIQDGDNSLYDKVLVDAECTHDGSIAHIKKYETDFGWENFEKMVLDSERLSSLHELQV